MKGGNTMIDGYVPFEDENEFGEKHPEVDVLAIKTAVASCQRTTAEKTALFKEGSNGIYDIHKIYNHSKSCVWCQRWLAWRKNEDERYLKPSTPFSDREEYLKGIKQAS
jgi:hypothetical protein